MIVKCKEIYNEFTNEYLPFDINGCRIKNYHYNVLEIKFIRKDVYYRVISDDSGMSDCSIIVRASDFEIIVNTIPDNWILNTQFSSLTPEKWINKSFWDSSFWEDYNEDKPEALKCYREEVKTIISADKEYIQTIIDERSKDDAFKTWRESMIPLLNEITTEN